MTALMASVVWLLVAAPVAEAQFGVDPDDWIAQAYGSNVETETVATQEYGFDGIYDQAGGHPWKGITDFTFRRTSPSGDAQGGNASNIRVDVPAGLVPNPTIFPRCPRAMFDAGSCLPDTQIGIEELTVKEGPVVARLRVPLYNVEIAPDQVSLFGFRPADAPGVVGLASAAGIHPVYIVGGVRDEPSQFGPHDNGLYFTIDDAPATPAVLRSKLTFWGVPGDAVHNDQRAQSCATVLDSTTLDPIAPPACLPPVTNVPSTVPDIPFLNNPTQCGGATLLTRLSLWSHGGAFATVDDPTPTIDGKRGPQRCDRVPFDSGLEVTPDTSQPDAPVGPLVRLVTPQQGLHDKDVITTSHVKDVSVTLPPGMTLNPSAANGLEACTDAQLAANPGVVGGDECPEASKVGTAAAKSPLLPDAVTGSAFVGQPLAGDMYRLFVTLEGRGVSVRLKGSVKPDPSTGQLTTTFANNPEQPVDTFDVDVENGSRAPLATPLDCGTKTASAITTPYSGTAPDTATGAFTIGAGGCSPGFGPVFGARTSSSTAGGFSQFTASFARPDRDQFLSGVRVDTPPGLGAIVKSMPRCSSALAAQGACPPSTLIGTASTRSGAGAEPFALSGPVYFTEGYKGAPFGMVVVVRAIAGPYDLGTVVVRQSIFVDPEDAHVTVVSDPLPQILEGVPIRLRTIDVTIDRSRFVYNPTACGAKPVGATLHSIQGTVGRPSASISTDRCQALGFKPRIAMRLTGRRQIKLGKHPGLRVRVRQARGQANIGRARVVLPLSLALDPANARAICGFEAGLKAQCPAKTRIGRARAFSPALNRPLRGPVYFVQGIRIDPKTGARIRTLPSLLVKLGGEVRINLRGTTDVVRRRLVSTFATLPDAPVSRFDMRLKGGKGGILTVATRARRGICARRRQISRATFIGHNGKRRVLRVKMAKPCPRRRS